MKKAVFFDIDGTLMDCLNGITDIRPRVKKQFAHFKQMEIVYLLQQADHMPF